MKRLQGNTIAKLCAWAVLLVAAFGTGIFGVQAVLSFGSVPTTAGRAPPGITTP